MCGCVCDRRRDQGVVHMWEVGFADYGPMASRWSGLTYVSPFGLTTVRAPEPPDVWHVLRCIRGLLCRQGNTPVKLWSSRDAIRSANDAVLPVIVNL